MSTEAKVLRIIGVSLAGVSLLFGWIGTVSVMAYFAAGSTAPLVSTMGEVAPPQSLAPFSAQLGLFLIPLAFFAMVLGVKLMRMSSKKHRERQEDGGTS